MITGFDHLVIAVRDLAQGVRAYETLLGRGAEPAREDDGVATAQIVTDNVAVELMAPVGDGETVQRLRAALEAGEGLKSVVFASGDLAATHRRCGRVGLAPAAISERAGWSSFRIDTDRSHGVRLFALQREAQLSAQPGLADGVTGLDHIVIRTPDAERAAALYGARLGLDMRLDREVRGAKLMFFRCGDAIVEIVHDATLTGADRLWGISWRVADADAARARLAAAGVDVSEVRTGMKPGTRVFTVRNQSCGVPTLMIEPSRNRD